MYYFGIIDILQSWTLQKRIERLVKVHILKHPEVGISCIPPDKQHERYDIMGSWVGTSIEYDKVVNRTILRLGLGLGLVKIAHRSTSLWKFVVIWILCMLCPIIQADSMCDIIAAPNIQSIEASWSCTADGVTSTPACTAGWYGVTCSGSTVVSIAIYTLGLTGNSNWQ